MEAPKPAPKAEAPKAEAPKAEKPEVKAEKKAEKPAAPKAEAPKPQPKQEAPAKPAGEVNAPTAPGSAGGVKLYNVEPKTAAMLMAIVADKLGKPLNELRFISIKEVSE